MQQYKHTYFHQFGFLIFFLTLVNTWPEHSISFFQLKCTDVLSYVTDKIQQLLKKKMEVIPVRIAQDPLNALCMFSDIKP